MKSLFITGASGFLGGAILAALNPDNFHQVTLLSRRKPALPGKLATAANVTVLQAAIDEVDAYAQHLDANTDIIHLAAITGKAAKQDYFEVNTEGTRKLSAAAAEAGVNGILFVSSIAVAFRDRRDYHYATSKELAENIISGSGLRYSIVRPTIILGEGSPIWDSFSSLAKNSLILLPGNGQVRIQPIHADDLAALILAIVSDDRFDNNVLELGGPDRLSLDDFLTRIHRAQKDTDPRIVHLPLGLILPPLRLVEKLFPNLLPVSAGQFASFHNEGTSTANDLAEKSGLTLKSIDTMVQQLTGAARHA